MLGLGSRFPRHAFERKGRDPMRGQVTLVTEKWLISGVWVKASSRAPLRAGRLVEIWWLSKYIYTVLFWHSGLIICRLFFWTTMESWFFNSAKTFDGRRKVNWWQSHAHSHNLGGGGINFFLLEGYIAALELDTSLCWRQPLSGAWLWSYTQ